MTHEEANTTASAMSIYGGHFCRALGDAFAVADIGSRERIQSAFPELFEKYGPGSDAYNSIIGCREFVNRRTAA